MRHLINQWIQRLIVPAMVVAGLILKHFSFGIVKMLSVLVALGSVLLLSATIVDPGLITRQLRESLGNRNKSYVLPLTDYTRTDNLRDTSTSGLPVARAR